LTNNCSHSEYTACLHVQCFTLNDEI
jgi:hypothetical protein